MLMNDDQDRGKSTKTAECKMPISTVHECQCIHCPGLEEHPDKNIHGQINLVVCYS